MDEQQWREAWELLRRSESVTETSADYGSSTVDPAVATRVRRILRAADATEHPSTARNWAGTQLEHYIVSEELGRGGMGVVHAGIDANLNRPVAIKFLPAEAVGNSVGLERFEKEARASSVLNHPNIVTIHDFVRQGDVVAIVMERIEGRTLRQTLAGPMPLTAFLPLARQIAQAIAAAHESGIIHRDIKPENIMVRLDGYAKLLDFGLAGLTEATSAPGEQPGHKTAAGGTLRYLSPEQATGFPAICASDVFSLGLVFHELLAGTHPLSEKTELSVMDAISTAAIPRIDKLRPDLPSRLTRLLAAMIAVNPAARPTAREVTAELASLSAAQTAGARKLLVVFLAVSGLIAGALWWQRDRLGISSRLYTPLPVATPFTYDPGLEERGVFSPAGHQVALTGDGGTRNFDIYVRPFRGRGQLRLTSAPEPEYDPAWSPDGDEIAFAARLPSGRVAIRIAPAAGGPLRTVAETGPFLVVPALQSLSWSPDGKTLAMLDVVAPGGSPPVLFALDLASGRRRPLTAPPPGIYAEGAPSFSPDGRMLAFVRFADYHQSELFVLDLRPDGSVSATRQLTFGNSQAISTAWTPDGRDIVFHAKVEDSSLWRIPCCRRAKPEMMTVAGEHGQYPSISRHGDLIFTRQTLRQNIYRQALDPRGAFVGLPEPLLVSTRTESEPHVSPDGSWVVFSSTRSGHSEIWRCRSNGMDCLQLTSLAPASSFQPIWSPDGTQIVFQSNPADNSDIYLMPAEGGAPRRITFEASVEQNPAWSPDGRWIYFASNKTGRKQIYRMPAGGGASELVVGDDTAEVYHGIVFRDDLYYVRSAKGGRSVWAMNLSDGKRHEVIPSLFESVYVPGKHGVYYLSLRTQAMLQPHGAGAAVKQRQIKNEGWGWPALSPDGSYVLYTHLVEYSKDLFQTRLSN